MMQMNFNVFDISCEYCPMIEFTVRATITRFSNIIARQKQYWIHVSFALIDKEVFLSK